ncbi:hypothetical protein J6590_041197 [Homalodisca vitripennis]|nr:hypothetical protein J6590_041197 [Homalodisca vitripennis]
MLFRVRYKTCTLFIDHAGKCHLHNYRAGDCHEKRLFEQFPGRVDRRGGLHNGNAQTELCTAQRRAARYRHSAQTLKALRRACEPQQGLCRTRYSRYSGSPFLDVTVIDLREPSDTSTHKTQSILNNVISIGARCTTLHHVAYVATTPAAMPCPTLLEDDVNVLAIEESWATVSAASWRY